MISTPQSGTPMLDVRALRVEFPGRHGTVTALADISLTIQPGEILGVVGESGAGKSMTGLAVQGLLEPPGHIAGGEVWLNGRRIDYLSDREMEQVRGREIGAIFQDPLTSLNPLFSVGKQLIETIRLHLPLNRSDARQRAIDLLTEVGIPGPETRVDHFPIFRRYAPARGDRLGACRPSQADHRGRTDHGAGCLDPGPDHFAFAPVV
jgi:peptide/nickel transport system ATP-binding protein